MTLYEICILLMQTPRESYSIEEAMADAGIDDRTLFLNLMLGEWQAHCNSLEEGLDDFRKKLGGIVDDVIGDAGE